MTRAGKMSPDQASRWLRSEAPRLLRLSPDDAVDEIHGELIQVDPRLAVEIADLETGRDLIISASGDADLFQVVEQVCAGLELPGWIVHALKPPRGFGFTITVDDQQLDASELRFEPLAFADAPGVLGIRLYSPAHQLAGVERLAGLIVETGVGERAAASIGTIMVEALGQRSADAIPIADLGAYLDWHARQK